MAFTTTGIMLGMAIGGTALSAYGQIRAGQAAKRAGEAQRDAAESQAQLADYNAAVADIQSRDALERGMEDEQRFRQKVRLLIGEQRAGQAAGNVDVGFGSAVDVQADAAFLGELDALQVRNNAAREAWGYKVQGEDLRKRAEIARKEGVYLEKAGGEQRTAAYTAAAGTILTGTTSLMMDRYGFSNARRRAA